jgi:hypothetical protein
MSLDEFESMSASALDPAWVKSLPV